jgi:mRNA interferase MazF
VQIGNLICDFIVNYNQGDIVLVPFPFTDGANSKPRPAIVVSNSKVNSTQDVILAQITSQPRADDFSFALENSSLDIPLHQSSQVRCHKIFTMQKSVIIKKISSLKSSGITSLKSKITGCL